MSIHPVSHTDRGILIVERINEQDINGGTKTTLIGFYVVLPDGTEVKLNAVTFEEAKSECSRRFGRG